MSTTSFHYGDQKFSDNGFGCSYRNLQTLLSFGNHEVPHIKNLLEYFIPNYEKLIQQHKYLPIWIEPFQVGQYLTNLFDWKCVNILYVIDDASTSSILKTDILIYLNDKTVLHQIETLHMLFLRHFNTESPLPILIDDGTYSYLVLNLDIVDNSVTIIDPHIMSSDKGVKSHKKHIDFLRRNMWMIMLPTIS